MHAASRSAQREGGVTIQPFSLWMLVVWGMIFFLSGFFSARTGTNFTTANLPLSSPPPAQSIPHTAEASPAANVPKSTTAEAHAPVVAHVVMKNMKFSPATIEIKKGDTVEWTNEDITPHTATARPIFDSGSIAPDKSWEHTFVKAGTLPYGCTFHPDMKGVVVIK